MSSNSNSARSSERNPIPSSASSGIFMKSPVLENQYHSDSSFIRVQGRYGRDAFGRRTDELVTSEGWRNLQKLGLKEGMVAIAYENEYGEYSRVVQFLKYTLWTGSCAYVTCPSAMQDGAASLLSRHLSIPHQSSSLSSTGRAVLNSAFKYLTTRDENAWTSGQWMTERVGGSDVSGTETLATYSPVNSGLGSTQIDGSPLGPWIVDGFKWFSSATDSQMSIALAQTPKGLSAFYIPMRRITPLGEYELNGISISRLKNKMGTRALPTAELELKGARAFLLGEEGNGVREIATILNITRVHTAVTSLGLFGRGLAIAKSFAEVREMAGKGKKRSLKDVPLHVHTLADLTVSYRANLLFTFFVIYFLGISDQTPSWKVSQRSFASDRLRPQTPEDLRLMLRVLTPTLKAMTAKASIAGLQECMEALGGVGYLENEESQHINVARLYRDVNVLSIWEGTTNVLGTDFVKTLKSRNGETTLKAIHSWLNHALAGCDTKTLPEFEDEKNHILSSFESFRSEIEGKELEELVIRARQLMEIFADIVIGTLMIVDAARDGDAVSVKIFKRFASNHGFGGPESSDWASEIVWDSKIVFGESTENESVKARL